MSNFGIGIGNFLEGIAKGAQLRSENDLAERKLKLLEGRDARDAESDALNMKKTQADIDYQTSERSAQAPILKAQRDATLTGLNDDAEMRSTFRSGSESAKSEYEAAKSKSIFVGKDAAGNPTYAVDGQKASSADDALKLFEQRHGTFMDSYRTKMLPQIVQGYLKRGDVKSAEAFEKWNNQKGVEKATQDYGRMMQSFALGDWDGVNKHLNSIVKNGDYLSQDHHDASAEPIIKDGQTVGLRIKYKNRTTNSESSKDFDDMNEFHQFAATMVAPDAAFEQGKADYAASVAAKQEKAKSANKLANDLTLEGVKNQNAVDIKQMEIAGKIAEKRADEFGLDPKDYTKAVLDMTKNMADNAMLMKVGPDGKSVPMTAEESIAAASDRVDQAIARQRGGRSIFPSSPGASAQIAPVRRRPAIFSRQAQAGALDAETQKLIGTPESRAASRGQRAALGASFPLLRSGERPAASAPPAGQTPIDRPLTISEQYAQKYGLPLYFTQEDVDAVLRQRSGNL